MNLRLKQTMAGEGAFVKLNKLYYLSVHTLDNAESVRFAKNRVGRELLDLWMTRRFRMEDWLLMTLQKASLQRIFVYSGTFSFARFFRGCDFFRRLFLLRINQPLVWF